VRVPVSFRRASNDTVMTPMIDVVFLLIIFFLVSSHLARQEVQWELDLPAARTGRDVVQQHRPRITVNVLRDGQIRLSGAVVSAVELLDRFEYESAKVPEPIEVRIRTDQTVPYRFVEPILAACARARIWDVTFSVVPESG